MTNVTPRDVESLIELFDGSEWKELHLELEGFEIHLSKDPARRLASASAAASAPATPRHDDGSAGRVPASPDAHGAPAHGPGAGAGAAVDPSWIAIRAPNLGTFYRAPKPGAPSFIELGARVSPETEVCLIEVMKLFTAVRAGVGGVVRKICADDGQMIEYDQVLIYVEPLG